MPNPVTGPRLELGLYRWLVIRRIRFWRIGKTPSIVINFLTFWVVGGTDPHNSQKHTYCYNRQQCLESLDWINSNWTFCPLISSLPGRFAPKMFHPLDISQTFPAIQLKRKHHQLNAFNYTCFKAIIHRAKGWLLMSMLCIDTLL